MGRGLAQGWGERPNEALQLTKREYLVGGPAPRAGVIESRFAAERRWWSQVNDATFRR